jgi:isoquinoline 1-oxidoreductase subunit beta
MGTTPEMNRREFIITTLTVSGGLALGITQPQASAATPSVGPRIGARPWESLLAPGETEVSAWIVIAPDDTVTIRVAQSDVGQGLFTSCAKIVVEELECDWSKVQVEYASANRHLKENFVYYEMHTFSSNSVRLGRIPLQRAGAHARERLMAAAAKQWSVPRSELKVKDGIITHLPSGRTVRYGQVARDAAAIELAEEPAIKTPDQFTFLNKPTPLLEAKPKSDGSAVYGIDVRLPGMLYAAVQASPVFGGKPAKYDASKIKSLPGIHSVVEFGGNGIEAGVAVVADSYWRAQAALAQMPIEWDRGPNAGDSSDAFFKMAHEGLNAPGDEVVAKKGDAVAAMKTAAKVVDATYELPYLDHAVMEPINCTAHVTPNRVEIWTGTQTPVEIVNSTVRLTGVASENVYVNNCFSGGGFGRRDNVDYPMQAVAIAKQVGAPVKVIWSREETVRHGRYRPMRVVRMQAGLGPDGVPQAWTTRVIGIEEAIPVNNEQTVRSLMEVAYAVPHQLVDWNFRPTRVPTGTLISVGRFANEFCMETFIDEVAVAAGKDPYQYRRSLLEANTAFRARKSWIKVLDTAAEKSGWGKKLQPGTGMGIAIGDNRRPSRSEITISSVVARVSVSKSGQVRVERVDVAMDTGPFLVNPLAVERQIEMQVAFAISEALYQEITIAGGGVVQRNFNDFPILSNRDMPDVGVHLIRASDEPIMGAGEECLAYIAPAVCNAIFSATGKRVRKLPVKNTNLAWA